MNLAKLLQKVEDKIPTYRVDHGDGLDMEDDFGDDADLLFDDGGFGGFADFIDQPGPTPSRGGNFATSFTGALLSQIDASSVSADKSEDGKPSVSMKLLQKLESAPWDYQPLFKIPVDDVSDGEAIVKVTEKVQLRDAIGERRYRAWKMAQDQKTGAEVDLFFTQDNLHASKQGSSLDLTSLTSSATTDTSDSTSLSSVSTRTSTLPPRSSE